MANISLFITNDKNKTVEFPMTPESFNVQKDAGNETIKVHELGEINRLSVAGGLETVSMKLRLPRDLRVRQTYFSAKTLAWKGKDGGERYYQFLDHIYKKKKVMRVVLTGTMFNGEYTIESLDVGTAADASEYVVNMELKAYRNYAPLIMKKVAKKKLVKKKPRPRPAKKLGAGSKVIVNGRLHYSSWGDGPGLTERNAVRVITHVSPGKPCPYHIGVLGGSVTKPYTWRGWVKASAVRAK